MRNFRRRSRRNIPGVCQVRAAPGGAFLHPAGVDLSAKRGARVVRKRQAPHGTVAALSLSDGMAERHRIVDGRLQVTGCRVVRGRHRCAEAALVVVRDLPILHDVGALAADEDTAVSFLYVVALGLDVVTATQLAAASYAPARLSPSQYLRHAVACRNKVAFRVGERLDVECPAVRTALRRIGRWPGSRMRVVASGAPASGGVSLLTLRDVVEWCVSARRVLNELGPKVLGADRARQRC